MPGVPGVATHVPKRSDQRRRENAPRTPVEKPAGGEVVIPDPNPAWHPIAARWFAGLAKSAQSVYYEQSDWDLAWLTAESLSRDFKPKVVGKTADGEPIFAEMPLSGSSLAAYLRTFNSLLVTEADRRRASIEVQRAKVDAQAEEVSSLDDYRRSLGAG